MSGAPQPPPPLFDDAHKGDAGRVLAICGSREMPGAAILVVRAAQRAGAGVVTLATFDANLLEVVPPASPETVYVDFSDTPGNPLPADFVSVLAERPDHARVCGPGLGRTKRTRAMVKTLVEGRAGIPVVLDADALSAIADEPGLPRRCSGPVVLTPHPGEAQRLLGRPVPRDDDGRRTAASELADRTGAVVCLKGARTVVATQERVWVNSTGNPGMATAGAGDVLAGVVAAYLAAWNAGGAPAWTPFDCAIAAVHVHGLAGDLAAEALGRRAVVASDLVEHLPAAQARFEDEA